MKSAASPSAPSDSRGRGSSSHVAHLNMNNNNHLNRNNSNDRPPSGPPRPPTHFNRTSNSNTQQQIINMQFHQVANGTFLQSSSHPSYFHSTTHSTAHSAAVAAAVASRPVQRAAVTPIPEEAFAAPTRINPSPVSSNASPCVPPGPLFPPTWPQLSLSRLQGIHHIPLIEEWKQRADHQKQPIKVNINLNFTSH